MDEVKETHNIGATRKLITPAKGDGTIKRPCERSERILINGSYGSL
jgi:hypothetical protein